MYLGSAVKKTHISSAMSMYQVKSIDADVKDVDAGARVVTGYFSTFGSVDSDRDMITRGAFAKSLQENGPGSERSRIVHLYQHDVNMLLGKPRVLQEDERGLYFETEIVRTSYGEDVLKLYEAGVINEHSIGFQVVKSQPKGDYTEINEVRLFEGSTVTFGANSDTPFTGMKAISDEQAIERVRRLTKAVRNGTFTDETFHLLEIQLKQLESYMLHTLGKRAQPVEATAPDVEPDEHKLLEAAIRNISNHKFEVKHGRNRGY